MKIKLILTAVALFLAGILSAQSQDGSELITEIASEMTELDAAESLYFTTESAPFVLSQYPGLASSDEELENSIASDTSDKTKLILTALAGACIGSIATIVGLYALVLFSQF